MSNHTLSVLVANAPGVLTRVAGLFSRRGFNIESLTVGPTQDAAVSRMTIVASTDTDEALEQIVKQLNKLVEVLKIIELEQGAVDRELILVKVFCTEQTRGAVLDIVTLFRAHTVDVGSDSVTVEATGSVDKLRAIVELLSPYGIIELATSGHVALARGAKAMSETKRPALAHH
ncbi:MAG: acetolactate synthase small subunit [Propionibacteriaceae bacterium]|nr:acetolactate synthase small subunit [Propionibacteriaceae bacterium]